MTTEETKPEETKPTACPTCKAPHPKIHPVSAINQETRPCPDPFHAQTEERAQLNAAIKGAVAIIRATLGPGARFVVYIDHERLIGGVANFVPVQPPIDAWAGTFDADALEGKAGPGLKAMAEKWLRENEQPILTTADGRPMTRQ